MSIAYFVKQIQPGEKIHKVVYKSARYFILSFFLSILLIWGGLFFYFLIEKKYGSPARWLIIFLVALGIYVLLGTIMKLKYTAWVITNERLIDFNQKNFWKNEINEVLLEELCCPKLIKKGIGSHIFNYYNLRVLMTEERALLEIEGIGKNSGIVKFLEKKLAANEINYED